MDFIPVCEPTLRGNEEKYVLEALRSGWISSAGQYVKSFEEQFATYCETSHGISTTNGTTALHLALKAMGVEPGDEVILPNFSMVATLFSVLYCGAKPVFVDIEEGTWNMDMNQVRERITPRTKVVMPVHLFGHPAEMEPLWKLSEEFGFKILEDAAEAHGATYKNKKAGNLGHAACFSFFSNKLITTGEGGMVVTNDPEIAHRSRYYKNLCFKVNGPRDYLHEDVGFNYRFTNLQAAVGLAQLERLEDYVEMRRKNALLYHELLAQIPGLQLPVEKPEVKNVYWMYAVTLEPKQFGMERAPLLEKLKAKGIDSRVFFTPLSAQPCLKRSGSAEDMRSYPVTQRVSENGFYLPSSSHLSEDQITYIGETLRQIQDMGK